MRREPKMSLGAEIEEMRRNQPMRLKKATSEIGGKSGKCNVIEAKRGKKKKVFLGGEIS